MNRTLAGMDKQIEGLAKKYPEIAVLRTAPGVGPVVAACYVLTLGHPETMETNRQAGAYLGLRPRQQQYGGLRPTMRDYQDGQQLPAQFAGAVGAINVGHFGPDSELRCWGLKLAACGGKRGKKRAIVAVARKLAVLLLSMWRNGKKFEPFP